MAQQTILINKSKYSSKDADVVLRYYVDRRKKSSFEIWSLSCKNRINILFYFPKESNKHVFRKKYTRKKKSAGKNIWRK